MSSRISQNEFKMMIQIWG